ncbi:hypothetical protein AS25_05635 [Kocuria marina]|uniref:Uncharacterized protein n=1 Tax=Kocuria marina TaxID=223184 RepID=A0A0B0DHB0_9MICC|nr:hypothetical protein [Kocuria marina]KHE74659.1 hypothetical protein AS25_05635 [Kocuria marina]
MLFTPDPLRLVAGHLDNVLQERAAALSGIAHAAERGDQNLAADAARRARAAAAELGPLTATRSTSQDIAARTLRGRRHARRSQDVVGRVDDAQIIVAAVLVLTDDLHKTIADGVRIDPDLPTVLHRLGSEATNVHRHLATEPPNRPDGRMI